MKRYNKRDKKGKFKVKEADSMETFVLVVFWGFIIIVAEIVKWAAAYHMLKYLPWIRFISGGH
jgi:hypothetical protein